LVVVGTGVPLQPDPFLVDTTLEYRPKRGGDAPVMQRYRRLLVSLGWLAAFLMAAGAGFKN
jgi:hypothetical protein